MVLSDHDLNIANELKERLLAIDQERKIDKLILYGSRARGTAGTDSDFDILVVEKDPVAKREETHRLHKEMCLTPYVLDIGVMGTQEFEETKEIIGGLAYPAHKYGQVLYEIS